VLAGYQVTSETAATRLLGRLGAALIELERWLPAHAEDLDLLARDRPDATVHVNDLPLSVVLPSSQVVDADQEELRQLMTRAMGRTLYDRGTGAFQDEQGAPRSLSIGEPVRWTVELLSSGAHRFWQAALLITALVLLVPAAGVMLAGRTPLTPIAIGAGLAAAASAAAWAIAGTAGGFFDSPVDKETMLILRDGAWIGLRNSLAVTAIAASLLVVISMVTRQRVEERTWPAPVEAESPPDYPSA
jgi:hypothetical protein